MCANIKVKYVGTNEEIFTTNATYQGLGFVGTGQVVVLRPTDGAPVTVHPVLNADWELVSVTVPGDPVQLYP